MATNDPFYQYEVSSPPEDETVDWGVHDSDGGGIGGDDGGGSFSGIVVVDGVLRSANINGNIGSAIT